VRRRHPRMHTHTHTNTLPCDHTLLHFVLARSSRTTRSWAATAPCCPRWCTCARLSRASRRNCRPARCSRSASSWRLTRPTATPTSRCCLRCCTSGASVCVCVCVCSGLWIRVVASGCCCCQRNHQHPSRLRSRVLQCHPCTTQHNTPTSGGNTTQHNTTQHKLCGHKPARLVPAPVRVNMVVALADLASRFPNVLEPWTAYMYEPLSGASAFCACRWSASLWQSFGGTHPAAPAHSSCKAPCGSPPSTRRRRPGAVCEARRAQQPDAPGAGWHGEGQGPRGARGHAAGGRLPRWGSLRRA
jgi:hypothetical protein